MAKSGMGAWGLRPKLTARQKHWLDKLSAVEPGLKLGELSSRLGEPYATVQRWTSFFGYPIRDGRTERAARVDWSSVNWRRSNVVIARELGVSRERVRQVRREVGVKPEKSAAERFAQFVALRQEQMQGLTVMQAVRASGLSLCYEIARDVLRSAGIGPFRRKHKEFNFNWKLPNRDLAVVHGLSIQQVANLRFRLNAGPAQWDVRGGRVLTDADYLSAREAEARKAQGAAGKPKPMKSQRLERTERRASGMNGHSFSDNNALKKTTRRSH